MTKKFLLFIVFATTVTAIPAQNRPASNSIKTIDTYSDTWAVTDALGRKAADYNKAGGLRGNKYAGIFYLIWHDDYMRGIMATDPLAPRNIEQTLRKNPGALEDANAWGPRSSYHWWGEPLYGHYNLRYDEYVLRRHAQLLTDAGVDFVAIDATNYFWDSNHNRESWNWDVLMTLCKVWNQIREEGGKTPKITFLMTWFGTGSAGGAAMLYRNFYAKGLYQELWFYYEGKPLMLCDRSGIAPLHTNNVNLVDFAHDPNPPYYAVRENPEDPDSKVVLTDEHVKFTAGDVTAMENFFTFRLGQPQITQVTGQQAWNWLNIYPQQPAYTLPAGGKRGNTKECMVVSPCQNWAADLDNNSITDQYGNFISRGRSWTSRERILSTNPVSPDYRTPEGLHFQEQWDRVHDIDPDIVFIAQWNEWLVGRFLTPWVATHSLPYIKPMGHFPDIFNAEYSRDLEMTREAGMMDNYYNQMVDNIRRFKGVRTPPKFKQTATMNINGHFEKWDKITSFYKSDKNGYAQRNYEGFGAGNAPGRAVNRGKYYNMTGNNDFKEVKVARDNKNLYFYIETYNDLNLIHTTTLYLKTAQAKGADFDFKIELAGGDGKTLTLERCQGGQNWTDVAQAIIPYATAENKLELSVKISDLHLNANEVNFEFKLFDYKQDGVNEIDEADAMKFYLFGEAAPNARFNYVYSESPLFTGHLSPTELFYEYGSGREAVDMTTGYSREAAIKFDATERFTSFEVMFYSDYYYHFYDFSYALSPEQYLGYKPGNTTDYRKSAVMTLYRWTGDYATSKQGAPVISKKIDHISDKTFGKLNFPEPLPKGEYLCVINQFSNPSLHSPALGLYRYGYMVSDIAPMTEAQRNAAKQTYTECYDIQLDANGNLNKAFSGVITGNYMSRIQYHSSSEIAGLKLNGGINLKYDSGIKDEHTADINLVIALPHELTVTGLRLSPFINKKGIVESFPSNFEITYSRDGVNYSPIRTQRYSNYLSTAASQSFLFNENITATHLKINITGLGSRVDGKYAAILENISVLTASDDRTLISKTGKTK